MDVDAYIRTKAQDEVYRRLYALARDLVVPIAERYGVSLWDDRLEVTPVGRAILEALVHLPPDPTRLPDLLVEMEVARIVDNAVAGSAHGPVVEPSPPPVEAPAEPPPTLTVDELLPTPPDLPEFTTPPNMDPKRRVPPFCESARHTLLERVALEGECLLWSGTLLGANRTTPTLKYRQNTYHARRAMPWLWAGHYDGRRVLKTTCGEVTCVRPAHLSGAR